MFIIFHSYKLSSYHCSARKSYAIHRSFNGFINFDIDLTFFAICLVETVFRYFQSNLIIIDDQYFGVRSDSQTIVMNPQVAHQGYITKFHKLANIEVMMLLPL